MRERYNVIPSFMQILKEGHQKNYCSTFCYPPCFVVVQYPETMSSTISVVQTATCLSNGLEASLAENQMSNLSSLKSKTRDSSMTVYWQRFEPEPAIPRRNQFLPACSARSPQGQHRAVKPVILLNSM